MARITAQRKEQMIYFVKNYGEVNNPTQILFNVAIKMLRELLGVDPQNGGER